MLANTHPGWRHSSVHIGPSYTSSMLMQISPRQDTARHYAKNAPTVRLSQSKTSQFSHFLRDGTFSQFTDLDNLQTPKHRGPSAISVGHKSGKNPKTSE